MTYIDKNIISSYTAFLEGLSINNKTELIDVLKKSLRANKKNKDTNFYKSFGAFASSKSPKIIFSEIKKARKFRKKEISF
jgi:hypothetical protein